MSLDNIVIMWRFNLPQKTMMSLWLYNVFKYQIVFIFIKCEVMSERREVNPMNVSTCYEFWVFVCILNIILEYPIKLLLVLDRTCHQIIDKWKNYWRNHLFSNLLMQCVWQIFKNSLNNVCMLVFIHDNILLYQRWKNILSLISITPKKGGCQCFWFYRFSHFPHQYFSISALQTSGYSVFSFFVAVFFYSNKLLIRGGHDQFIRFYWQYFGTIRGSCWKFA